MDQRNVAHSMMTVSDSVTGDSTSSVRNVTYRMIMATAITVGDSPFSRDIVAYYRSLPVVQLKWWIRTVCLPVVIVLGVFGNVMTIIVVSRFQANRSALDPYFLCLAVSDLCVNVLSPLLVWITILTGFELGNLHDVVCKALSFTGNAATACSAWFVVVMVTHRAMSVVWPHRVKVLCTAKTSWGIIVGVVVLFSLVYSHYLYGMEVYNGICTVKPGYLEFLHRVGLKLNLVLSCVLPFICLMISNIVLVVKLRTSVKEAGDQFTATDTQQRQRERKVNSITLTALVVSVSFIVFTLPFAINMSLELLYLFSTDVRNIHDLALDQFLSALFFVIACFNYSMNFYLYCLTGQRFRKEFLKLMSALVFCIRSSKL